MSIFDNYSAGLAFDATDAPGTIPQQHDVPGVALHGEILVESSDDGPFRFEDNREQSGLRNGSAAGDSGKPGTPARS